MTRLCNARLALAATAALGASTARASFFSGEAMDKAADIVALVVLVVVPVVLITVFWLLHILPEKVAEQRHHPQKDAVKVLCLLSLVFGGLLWPLAWILAYSKPVLYRMAYGRDKHDDYYKERAEQAPGDAGLLGTEVTQLRAELDALAARGKLPDELREMHDRLVAIESRVVAPRAPEGAG